MIVQYINDNKTTKYNNYYNKIIIIIFKTIVLLFKLVLSKPNIIL